MDDDQRKCPFCAELIKKEAVLCKHCKSNLPPNFEPVARRNNIFTSAPQGQKPKKIDFPKWGRPTAIYFGILGATFLVSFVPNYYLDVACAVLTLTAGLVSLAGLASRRFRSRAAVSLVGCFALVCSTGSTLDKTEPADVKKQRLEQQFNEQKQKLQEEKQKQQQEKQEQAAEAAKLDKDCPPMGEPGFLNQEATLANSEESMKSLDEALAAKDKYGFGELLLSGSVAIFKRGTRVQVLGSCGALYSERKLRVLSGQHEGEVWYAPFEFVSRKLH